MPSATHASRWQAHGSASHCAVVVVESSAHVSGTANTLPWVPQCRTFGKRARTATATSRGVCASRLRQTASCSSVPVRLAPTDIFCTVQSFVSFMGVSSSCTDVCLPYSVCYTTHQSQEKLSVHSRLHHSVWSVYPASDACCATALPLKECRRGQRHLCLYSGITSRRFPVLPAGDSHTAALTERGAVYAWGTFRDSSGVMGFSAGQRIQVLPACVYQPAGADEQIVQIASGAPSSVSGQVGCACIPHRAYCNPLRVSTAVPASRFPLEEFQLAKHHRIYLTPLFISQCKRASRQLLN